MSQKIVIETCNVCPHKDHKGGFGNPAYVPICRKKDRELPYTVSAHQGSRNFGVMVTASQKGGIPEWCPLPNDE